MKKYIKSILKKLLNLLSNSPVYANITILKEGEKLVNKNIFITGGAKGIGYAITKKCIEDGARVVISGRDEDALYKVSQEFGNRCHYIVFDINDVENYSVNLAKIENILGQIDAIVLNAGISIHEKSFTDVTVEGFSRQFDTNLKSNYFLVQEYLKHFVRENGNVLFVSSETADMCSELPYGLTKSSLNSLVGALSRRYYKSGIRINAICPGVTLSNMVKLNNDDGNIACNNASGRFFLPEEVAEVAAFLLSDVSQCISGETIHTNAGNHLRPQFSSLL